MHHFSVWAPARKKVSIQVDGKVYPMVGPTERGYWSAEVKDACAGSDYGFLLDDDSTPYPDPRSRWQANGVHGLSRVLDQHQFRWTDDGFRAKPLSSAILYEMHIGTFTPGGTFDSAIEKLDYLVDLGITHVEILPIASFEGSRSWGYDGVSPYAPDEVYGGPEGAKRFVDACHAKNLGVVLDVVYNHFGPTGNYTGLFGPYITDRHHTPWGVAINLEDAGSTEVRRYFIDNALMWLRDYHFDGLRLDATHELIDRSGMHFLEQLSREVEDLSAVAGKKFFLIAETDLNDPTFVTSYEAGGYGMDAQWNDDFHHALFAQITGDRDAYYADFDRIEHLAKALRQGFVYAGDYSPFRQKVQGKLPLNISYHRFLGYAHNHDQVGNRAKGDRIAQVAGDRAARLAAAVVLTAPFVPMLFMGEEFAAATPWQFFADFEDPELRKAVSEGRKREFKKFGFENVPDPNDLSTFENSRLNWKELDEPEHASMLEWYRKLIHLRKRVPSLNLGDFRCMKVEFDEGERWIRTTRGDVLTILNFSDKPTQHTLPHGAELLLSSASAPEHGDGKVTAPPVSAAIFHLPRASQKGAYY